MSIDEKKFMFKALIIGELLDTPLDAFGLQVGDTAEGFLCKKFAQDGELITVLQIPISGTQICEAIVDLETARALTEFVETVSNNEPKKRAIPQNPKSPSPLRAIFQTNSGEKIEITLKKGKDNFPIATADNGDTYEPQDGILLTNANRRILEYGENDNEY
ncbi:hypothetical protein AGMMS49975_27420 [Clostridia bacterium]|nr:hypothetical protein AGMMS49975_27420 [Clostridia bacterium]